MVDLFETPVRSKRVRKGVFAHQYRNGTINIEGTKFVMHSMTSAIQAWRKKNPVTGYDRWLKSLSKK